MKRRNPASQKRRASAAHFEAGRPGRKTNGFASAVIRGTRSIPEASAQLASISGLRRGVSLVAVGCRIPIGTLADPTLNEAIAEVHSRYSSMYGWRCR